MIGIEYQYGRRDAVDNAFHSTGSKLQLSFQFGFSKVFVDKGLD